MNAEQQIKELGEEFGKTLKAHEEVVKEIQKRVGEDGELTKKQDSMLADMTSLKERADALEAAMKREAAERDVLEENRDLKDEWQKFKKRHGLHLKGTGGDDALDAKVYANFKSANEKNFRMREDKKGHKQHIFPLTDDEQKAEDLIYKALTGATAAGGGMLLSEIEEDSMERQLRIGNPIRDYASVVSVSVQQYERNWQRGSGGFGWVGETDARNDTTDVKYEKVTYDVNEIYCQPRVSQNLLDDARYDVSQLVINEAADIFGIQERRAFTKGTGTTAGKQPLGLVAATIETDRATKGDPEDRDVDDFFAIQTAGTLKATAGDKLLEVFAELPREYRANARWFMSRKIWAELMKLQNDDKDYRLQWDPRSPMQFRLWGFEVIEIDDMTEDATTDNGILLGFGDMRRAYQIVDRQGMRVLVDPYTSKPYVRFYCTRRVGGGPADGAAMIFLKKTS